MSVNKQSPNEIRRAGETYTVLVDSAANMLGAEALAAYAYLMSRPADWTIRVRDICNRFGWAYDGTIWRRVSKELRAAGLLYDIRVSEGGKVKTVVECSSVPRSVENQRVTDPLENNGSLIRGNSTGAPPLKTNGHTHYGVSTQESPYQGETGITTESTTEGGDHAVDWSASLTGGAWG